MRFKVSLSSLLTVALILSLLENINLLSWRDFLAPREPDASEKAYIDRAAKVQADKDKVPIESVLKMTTPSLMEFSKFICVQLAPYN